MSLLSQKWVAQGCDGGYMIIPGTYAPFDFVLCHPKPPVLKMAVRAPAIIFSLQA